ncbi:MAG TPA: transcription antitermination factor NusB [Patescibacteria group bacterium]|nr:transcription antitermination factor NusB [Patescibacteria group bacterium]
MQALFAYDFSHDQVDPSLTELLEKLPAIDGEIHEAAPNWPLEQINKVDLAILRNSVYELLNSDTPPKVVIDEAIELAKEYGAENSPKFVNGVLAHIAEKTHKLA